MPEYAVRYVPSWVEREGYAERILIGEAWTDNGVYCELMRDVGGVWTPVKDVSMHCRRYGRVNPAKKGTYNIEYKFENYPVGRDADGKPATPQFMRYAGGGVEFVPLVTRTVEVYEPDWIERITPPHYQWFPIIKQTLQKYSDIYWELNYRSDWTRMGLENRTIPCERYTTDFTVPAGAVLKVLGNAWFLIVGHTFALGQSVAVTDPETKERLPDEFVVFRIKKEQEYWSESGRKLDESRRGYLRNDYVRYLDKEYICNVGHDFNNDKYSRTSVIIPGEGDAEDGEPYWIPACTVRLAVYEYGDYQRKFSFDNGAIRRIEAGGGVFGLRNFVDSQGYIFQYDYGVAGVEIEPEDDSFTRHVDIRSGSYAHEELMLETYDRIRYMKALKNIRGSK
jgi:hypothetical protein